MSLDFDNIVVKVENRTVQVGSSEIPIIALSTASWEDITGKPDTFPPSPHDHDDRYYTEAEVDALLDSKQDVLTFDDAPTAGSSNPVTSDGIKTAIDNKADIITVTASGQMISFSDGAGMPAAGLTAAIEGAQSGSGDPSPENVRPLSGWDSATLWHTGKNLLHCTGLKSHKGITASENANGSITVAGTPTANYADIMTAKSQVLKAGTYTFSISKTLACSAIIRLAYTSAAGDYVSLGISAGQTSATVTASRDVHFWRLYVSGMTVGTAINETFFVQVEAGSEPTPYEPCTESVLPVSFGDAETVYNGILDPLTGTLTVTQVLRTFTSAISYSESTHIARIAEDGKPWSANVFYSYLKTVSGTSPAAGEGTRVSSSKRLLINLAGVTTLEECNTYLAANPLQVAYELAAPLTYQLTPAEVTILSGENRIWVDAGAVSVTYHADTKLYIDSKIAESQRATRSLIAGIESAMVATKNYSTGALLIVGDTLYKATANIANGGAITPGTNVTATTVAEQLILLANA